MWNWISGTSASSKSPAAASLSDSAQNTPEIKTTTKEDKHDVSTEKNVEADNTQEQIEKQEQSTESSVSLKDTASSVGSFLFNVATAASKTASKLKETVDDKLDKTIIGDFQRENEKFVQEKKSKVKEEPVPPWVGYLEEEEMKSQILSLSTDDRNFLRDPPSGVEFHFDLENVMPVALATLADDKNLSNMRFKLVPQKLSEERFWRNYFYRVSLIKQKSQLSRLADTETKRPQSRGSNEKINHKEADHPKQSKQETAAKDIVISSEISNALEEIVPDSPTSHEFISDNYAVGQQEGLSIEEMSQLNMKDKPENTKTSTEWENELQNELQEFEFVSETAGDEEPDPNWEKEIEEMLNLEDE